MVAKTGATVVFVATDKNPMLKELAEALNPQKVQLIHIVYHTTTRIYNIPKFVCKVEF